MPKVIVGGHATEVTWQEFAVAIMPKGTPVEWHDPGMRSLLPSKQSSGTGILVNSSFYDGMCAHIDVMGEMVYVHLSLGARVRRLRDRKKLAALGVNGEGI